MNSLSPDQILALIPQQSPFRFVDAITEIGPDHIQGHYTFKKNESFYKGHFPENPVTPGVILLESMCQIGVVALGIYLLSLETSPEEARKWTTFFTDAETEFSKPVLPGQKVIVQGQKVFWRRKKLKSNIEMYTEAGDLVARTSASGIGVRQ